MYWGSGVCSSDLLPQFHRAQKYLAVVAFGADTALRSLSSCLFDDPESALLRLHVTGETLISDIVKPALLSLRMPQFDDTALVGARWGRCARQRCIRFQKSAFRLYSLRVTCLPCLSERIGPRCLKSFKPHFIGGRDHIAPIRDGIRRTAEHTSE